MVARPRSARVAFASARYADARVVSLGLGLGFRREIAGMVGGAILHRLADALLVRGNEGSVAVLDDDDLGEICWPEDPGHGAQIRVHLARSGLVGGLGILADWDALALTVLRDRSSFQWKPPQVSDGNPPAVSGGNDVAPTSDAVSGFSGETGGGSEGSKEVSPPHTPPLQERPSGSFPDGSFSSAPEAEKNQKTPPAGARAQDREPPWDALLQAWNTVATEHRLPRVRRLDAERKKLLGPWWRACGSDFAVAERAMFEAAKAYGGMEGDKAYGLFNMIRPSTRQKWITAAEEALDRPHADTLAGDFRDDLAKELEEAYPPIQAPPPAPAQDLPERIDEYLNRLFTEKGLALPEGYEGPDPRRVRPGDVVASAAAQRQIRALLSKHPERIPS